MTTWHEDVRTTGAAHERTLLTVNMEPLTPKYKTLRAKNPYIIFLLSRRTPYQACIGRWVRGVNLNNDIGLLTTYNHGTMQAEVIE